MPYPGIPDSMIPKMDRCVKDVMSDPKFKPKEGRDKKSSAIAICMAQLTKDVTLAKAGADINDLPDSAFAYIEPGGTKEDGKTVPRSKRHFPIHDKAHVRNALARLNQSPFGPKAKEKIIAAAHKMGIEVGTEKAISFTGVRAFAITNYFEKGESRIVEGIATTINPDLDQEQMSKEALLKMVDQIKSTPVPLRSEHKQDWNEILGEVYDAEIVDGTKLKIKAKLNKTSLANDLWEGLKSGARLGLSVAGEVRKYGMELCESMGKKIRTFKDVVLKEISVTARPANTMTWLSVIAKSIDFEKGDIMSDDITPEESIETEEVAEVETEVEAEVETEVTETAVEEEGEASPEADSEEPEAQDTEVETVAKGRYMSQKNLDGLKEAITALQRFLREEESEPAEEEGVHKGKAKKEDEDTRKEDCKSKKTRKEDEDAKKEDEDEDEDAKKEDTKKKPMESRDGKLYKKSFGGYVDLILEKAITEAVEPYKAQISKLEKSVDHLMGLPLQRKGIAAISEKQFVGNPETSIDVTKTLGRGLNTQESYILKMYGQAELDRHLSHQPKQLSTPESFTN